MSIEFNKNDKNDLSFNINENEIAEHKLLMTNREILLEAKELLYFSENESKYCVSLYDIAKLISKINNDYYYSIIDEYEVLLNDIIKSKFYSCIGIIIDEFNYNNNELNITIMDDYNDLKKISIFKANDNLYISNSKDIYESKILYPLYSELSKLYDKLYDFSKYRNKYISGIRVINSNFFVDMNNCFIKVLSNKFDSASEFKLISNTINSKYSVKSNSLLLHILLLRKKEDFLKKAFVNISDCPEWCQEELYKIRLSQLEENQKAEKRKQKKLIH